MGPENARKTMYLCRKVRRLYRVTAYVNIVNTCTIHDPIIKVDDTGF